MNDNHETEHDFHVHGTLNVILLIPVSPAAIEWCERYMPEDAPRHGAGYGIERRYFEEVHNGIIEDGLTVGSS